VTFAFTGLWLELVGPPVNGQFQFVLHGSPGNVYQIQWATNLINWSTLVTLTNSPTNISGALPFTDSLPANTPRRFYRAQQQP
jgi:hypothetical protein